MSLPILDTYSASPYISLYTFTWGDSSVAKYARWTEDVVMDDGTYLAEPSLSWSLDGALTGGVDDTTLSLMSRLTIAPISTLILPYKHSRCTVKIEEVSAEDLTQRTEIYTGRVKECVVKPSGQQGLVKTTLSGVKSLLTGSLGITATSTCVWVFGDRGGSKCGIPLAPITENATVSFLYAQNHPNRLTLAFAGDPDRSNARWKNGFVEYDGLKIPIRRSLNDGTDRFDMRYALPPYWLNKAVTVVPGCDQSLSRCRYWDNEAKFLALGYAMPLRNPIFQQ